MVTSEDFREEGDRNLTFKYMHAYIHMKEGRKEGEKELSQGVKQMISYLLQEKSSIEGKGIFYSELT